MEQNDIYYVIFPVRLPLHDFSFIQIILFLRNAKMSVLFLSLCFLFCVVFSHIQDNVRWLPQFATKWLSFCIRLSFEPTRTIWTQKLFPLIVSSWKSHFLECIEPVQKEMAFLWRVIKQRLFEFCLTRQSCFEGLCDIPVGASLWWCHQNQRLEEEGKSHQH